MSKENIFSVIAVVAVKDQAKSEAYYQQIFGRKADLVPFEGVAEWKIAEGAWVQVGADPEKAGSSTVILGVTDVEKQREICKERGITLSETEEIPGLIKMAEAEDPDANKVVFVQELS